MTPLNITSYGDLLKAAQQQVEPPRLLFVFTAAELPDAPSATQQAKYEANQGGTLTPVMCVDKLPTEVVRFDDLVEESRHTGQAWDIVFVASLSGRAGMPPSSDEAEQPLYMMVDAVKQGRISAFLAFDKHGELVTFF